MSVIEKRYWSTGVEHGRELERARITKELEAEIQELKKYGRTELWGLHKALLIVNQPPEEEEE
jgi:hypothetical protein